MQSKSMVTNDDDDMMIVFNKIHLMAATDFISECATDYMRTEPFSD